jgi:hypothetical protein
MVRILTPVYDLKVEGAHSFTHIGRYKGAEFKVVLRPYAGPADLDALVNLAHANNRPLIRQGFQRFDAGAVGCHVLLIEVALPGSAYALDMGIATEVQLSTAEALRLHSMAGLPHDDPLMFSDAAILARVGWISRQSPVSHLPKPSVLRSDDFAACRATGDILRSKAWGNTTFDKVVGLAKEYHRFCFTPEKVEHAFLILMVAFEAMFKKKDEDNASRAAQRIGRLLGTTKSECMSIHKEFFDNREDWFSKIRNDIAHGDSSLSLATVAGKYPSLYHHVTTAIITLLNLPSGSIDDTKDYYDEISRLTDTRFFSLPNS